MSVTSVRALSLDPGLTMAGWATIDQKSNNPKLIIHRFGTITPNRVAETSAMRDSVECYGKRVIALSVLEGNMRQLIETYKPGYLVTEDVFYNPKMPNAYMALVQLISTVEMLAYREFQLPLYKIPTRTAKQCLVGDGGCLKSNVQDAIFFRDDIVFKQKSQITTLKEHEADAIAVGIAFYHLKLPTL